MSLGGPAHLGIRFFWSAEPEFTSVLSMFALSTPDGNGLPSVWLRDPAEKGPLLAICIAPQPSLFAPSLADALESP